MEIQLFIPCFVDQLFPETGTYMVKILEYNNINIRYNPEQTCCGQIAFNSGQWKEAARLAKKFLRDFDPSIPIVTPSASCAAYLKNYFSTLFQPGSNEYSTFDRLTVNLYELSDFLANKTINFRTKAIFEHTVTFHDSCSGLREYKLKTEARDLLKKVSGIKLVEMDDTNECCGFGGTFSIKHKYISQSMVQQKVESALKTGAEYITSTEVSCLMNIGSYIKKHQLPINVIHFSEILAQGV